LANSVKQSEQQRNQATKFRTADAAGAAMELCFFVPSLFKKKSPDSRRGLKVEARLTSADRTSSAKSPNLSGL
jgi:hypothetical protein